MFGPRPAMSKARSGIGGSDARGEDQRLVRVKLQNAATHLDPMFAEQLDIIFDGINPISRKKFAETYGLCNRG